MDEQTQNTYAWTENDYVLHMSKHKRQMSQLTKNWKAVLFPPSYSVCGASPRLSASPAPCPALWSRHCFFGLIVGARLSPPAIASSVYPPCSRQREQGAQTDTQTDRQTGSLLLRVGSMNRVKGWTKNPMCKNVKHSLDLGVSDVVSITVHMIVKGVST